MNFVHCVLLLAMMSSTRVPPIDVSVRPAHPVNVATEATAAADTTSLSSVGYMTVTLVVDKKLYEEAVARSTPQNAFSFTAMDAQRKAVAIEARWSGEMVRDTSVAVTFNAQIPIDATERDKQIAEYIDTVLAQEAAPAEAQMKEWLRTHRDDAIAAIRTMFVQNRVGDFKVRATLGDAAQPAAQGEAVIRIADHGKFITQLLTEKKPTQ